MTTTRSPKFRRLIKLTGLNRAAAAGTLELLWLFTMEQSPAGDVGKWCDDDLESELDWEGERGALIAALIEAGWLDTSPVHRLVIHDWSDHLPDFIQKRVDRGTLTLAIPSAATGGHRRPPAANGRNVPIREGKGREGKLREEKRSQGRTGADAPISPHSRSPEIRNGKGSRGPKTYRPERFDGEARDRIIEWAHVKGYCDRVLSEAFDAWDSWGTDDLRTMRGWESSFKGIVRRALESGQIKLETEAEKVSRQSKQFQSKGDS